MMLSKITIEVDFENGNQPVIQIIKKKSDDIRDNLLQRLFETLGGTSSWGKIKYIADHFDPINKENSFERIFIYPIKESELKVEADAMLEQATLNRRWEQTQQQPLSQ